jgi:predicted HTH transcriptional regulator
MARNSRILQFRRSNWRNRHTQRNRRRILSQWHPLLAQLPVESIVFVHQAEYYQAINASTQQTNCAPFIEFMLSTIANTLAQNATVNAPVNLADLTTPDAILLLLTENKEMTRQQMAERIGKDIRTIGRAIAKLQQAGKLKRTGSDKTRHWEVVTT